MAGEGFRLVEEAAEMEWETRLFTTSTAVPSLALECV